MQYFSRYSTFTGMVAMLMSLLLRLSLATALPQAHTTAVAELTFPGWTSNTGQGGFCFKGWDKPRYRGNWVEACCFNSCCSFSNNLLSKKLFSAAATDSSTGGVTLWTSSSCSGKNRWVDLEGWYDLSNAPAYYSMSW